MKCELEMEIDQFEEQTSRARFTCTRCGRQSKWFYGKHQAREAMEQCPPCRVKETDIELSESEKYEKTDIEVV